MAACVGGAGLLWRLVTGPQKLATERLSACPWEGLQLEALSPSGTALANDVSALGSAVVPLSPSGIVVDPLQNTLTRLPSRSSDLPIDESSVAPGSMQSQGGSKFFGKPQSDNCKTPKLLENEPSFHLNLWLYQIIVCLIAFQAGASSVRESDVQTGESSLTPGSIQTSPRELTRSQGELARSSLENADPVIERRRIVGKQTTISPASLVLSDNVDSASVPESLKEAGLPEVLESCESETQKRRVESFDQSVDWFQRDRSSTTRNI